MIFGEIYDVSGFFNVRREPSSSN